RCAALANSISSCSCTRTSKSPSRWWSSLKPDWIRLLGVTDNGRFGVRCRLWLRGAVQANRRERPEGFQIRPRLPGHGLVTAFLCAAAAGCADQSVVGADGQRRSAGGRVFHCVIHRLVTCVARVLPVSWWT